MQVIIIISIFLIITTIIIYKINDKRKNGIREPFESAFLCINLEKLSKKYPLAQVFIKIIKILLLH